MIDTESSIKVDWNNFLDEELLPGIIDTEIFISDNNNDKVFTKKSPIDNKVLKANDTNNEGQMEIIMKHNSTPNSDGMRKKTEHPDATLVPKTKYSNRKQNYTTAVKNWLNDIENTGADILNIQNNITSDKITNLVVDTQNSAKKSKNKRTVQAQLTNIDGVMKFKKHKEMKIVKTVLKDGVDFDPEVRYTTEDATRSDHGHEGMSATDRTVHLNNSNKNPKPKFVAPIKYPPVSVKDMTYDVVVVNEVGQCRPLLESSHAEAAVVTLVFGNGFSQLNGRHTGDAGPPEGLMILIDDIYYYFKGNEQNFEDLFLFILNKNVIGYGLKNVLMFLMSHFSINISDIRLNLFDAQVGACLLQPDSPPADFFALQKLVGSTPDYALATASALQTCAWHLGALRPCAERLRALLAERELWKLFVDIEMRVLPVIAVMEHRGVCVDVEKLESMERELLKRLKATELLCHAAAGKSFQINSAVQVRTILYDELHLDTRSNVKIRETICKGAKSTSETMLRSLMSIHPLPKLILQYRHLHKAHATFLAGVAQRVRRGVVQPTWIQTAAATGRIACSDPNLQAIPKTPFSLDLFSEDKERGPAPLRLRAAFAARAGRSLLAADFRQMECRLLAQLAADAGLLAALAGPDLFRELAAAWLNVRAASVSAAQRERAKRVVYAGLYGAGGRRLAAQLGAPAERALVVLDSFNRTFPSLRQFARRVAAGARAAGGRVRTASGRARDCPGVASADRAVRAHAERQAVNFVVQGLAADVCKLAMARTARAARGARLLLQVHDELVWEVRDADVSAAADIIKSTMEQCGREFGLSEPLPVALSWGPNWGDLTPLP